MGQAKSVEDSQYKYLQEFMQKNLILIVLKWSNDYGAITITIMYQNNGNMKALMVMECHWKEPSVFL